MRRRGRTQFVAKRHLPRGKNAALPKASIDGKRQMSPAGKRQKRGRGGFSSAVKPCYGLIINLTAKFFSQRTPPPLCGTSPKMGGRAICVNIFQNTYVASRVSRRH